MSKEWITESELCKIVSHNLKGLIEATGWTQKLFAEKLGVAVGALSNYKTGMTLPRLDFIVNVCTMPEIKKMENVPKFTLEQFITQELDFSRPLVSEPEQRESAISNLPHKDYVGNYLMYLFDQSSALTDSDVRSSRDLRYGVLNVHEQKNITGEYTIEAYARFYKDVRKAVDFKEHIDLSLTKENDFRTIYEAFFYDKEYYTGTMSFSENHTFLELSSPYFADKALIILYAPPKKADVAYIGGLGSLASVGRGRSHMPVAQKIILSRYALENSKEEIGTHLLMNPANIVMKEEAKALVQLFEKLYPANPEADQAAKFLDRNDKQAIFENRLTQIIRNYIEKELCSIGGVTEADDAVLYKLIKKSAMTDRKTKANI